MSDKTFRCNLAIDPSDDGGGVCISRPVWLEQRVAPFVANPCGGTAPMTSVLVVCRHLSHCQYLPANSTSKATAFSVNWNDGTSDIDFSSLNKFRASLALVDLSEFLCKLTLIDRLRATRWTAPDYWQTDNSNGLVMVIRNYYWLNSASRVLISTCSAPLVQTG